MDQPVDIALEGELNCWTCGFDLPDLLLAVCRTDKTGLLRFVNSEAEKTLFLRDGKIIFAKSTSVDDRLGEYLLREGKISLQDLEKCAHLVKPGKRLGTLLVENGMLGPKELVQAVIGQVRAIVLSLFRWTEAWYDFNEKELPSKETITLDMPTSQLILDGVKLIESWRRITQGLGDMSSVYRRVSGNGEVLRDLELDAATLQVLDRLSRPKSVADACADSELGDLEVCRMMWVFRSFGWIEKLDEAETQLPLQTPEEVAEAAPAQEEPPALAEEVDIPPPPADRELPAAPAADETSFDIVEGDVIELPEGDETSTSEAPSEATPVMLGTAETTAGAEIPELSLVDPPVSVSASASAADINASSIAAPRPKVPEPEIDLGNPFAADASDPAVDLGASSSSPPSDPEIDLGNPPTPSESHPEVEEPPAVSGLESSLSESRESVPETVLEPEAAVEPEDPSATSLEAEGDNGPPDKDSPKKEPVVEADDMDLEGLGMVLGNDSKE